MSEPDKKLPRSIVRTLRVLAGSACGFLVGIGCCGVDSHLHPNAEFGGGAFATVGTALLTVSALTFAGSLLVLVSLMIWKLFSEKPD